MTGQPPEPSLEAIRAALRALVADDLPELIAQARHEAQSRVRGLLADAMTEAMLEQAQTRLAPERQPQPQRQRQPQSQRQPQPQRQPPPQRQAKPRPALRPEPPQPAGTNEHELGLYVYCIVPADAPALTTELAGIDPAHPPTLLGHDELAAVVSRVPLSDFGEERLREKLADMEWLEHTARSHEQVLEAIGEDTTLIPMRLCTIFRGESGVLEMLMREQPALQEALEHLMDKSEWGVKVFAAEVQREDAPPGPGRDAPGQARGQDGPGDATRPDGTAYMRARRAERDQREQHVEELHQSCAAIHDALAAVAADAITVPPQRPEVSGHAGEMLLSGVYLVQDGQLATFLNEVEALQDEYAEQGLEIEPTGPWPAYNFVPGTIGAAW